MKKPHIIAGKSLNTFYKRSPKGYHDFYLSLNPELLGLLENPVTE